jgi:hypothetical protein
MTWLPDGYPVGQAVHGGTPLPDYDQQRRHDP